MCIHATGKVCNLPCVEKDGKFLNNTGIFISGRRQVPYSNEIKLAVDSHGGYSLSVGSTAWLMSAPTFVTAGGKTYSTNASAANKLNLKGTKMSSGQDNIGNWTSTIFMYELGTTSLQVHMIVRQYESFAIFEQVRTSYVHRIKQKLQNI